MKSISFFLVLLVLVVDMSLANDPDCVAAIKSAIKKCDQQFDNDKKDYGDTGDAGSCCIKAKYAHCIESKVTKGCRSNPVAMGILAAAKAQVRNYLNYHDCGAYGEYPSAACVLFMNKLYFIIGGVVLAVLIVGTALICIRRRRRAVVIHRSF